MRSIGIQPHFKSDRIILTIVVAFFRVHDLFHCDEWRKAPIIFFEIKYMLDFFVEKEKY